MRLPGRVGAARADDHGLALPRVAVGADARAGARRLRDVANAIADFEDVTMIAGSARRRAARHAPPAAGACRSSSCRSTTRGCVTAGRSTSSTTAGGRARGALRLQRLGGEVPALGQGRGDRRADRARARRRGARGADGARGRLGDQRRRRHDPDDRAVPARPNRNPSLSRDAIEELLAEYLGRRAHRLARAGPGRGSRHRRARRPDRGLHPRPAGCWCRPSRRATPTTSDCAENVERLARRRDRDDRGSAPALRARSPASRSPSAT